MKKSRHKGPEVTLTREVTITNALGLHARPAASLVRQANVFRSEIWLITAAGRFSALSLIDVMRANVEQGARVILEAKGEDAAEALESLALLVRQLKD